METKKGILKQPCKDGSIVVVEEAAQIMMTMTIIKDLHVVAAKVPAVGKAEDGMVMKEDIPARRDKAGVIVIDFVMAISEKVHCSSWFNVPFLYGKTINMM